MRFDHMKCCIMLTHIDLFMNTEYIIIMIWLQLGRTN